MQQIQTPVQGVSIKNNSATSFTNVASSLLSKKAYLNEMGRNTSADLTTPNNSSSSPSTNTTSTPHNSTHLNYFSSKPYQTFYYPENNNIFQKHQTGQTEDPIHFSSNQQAYSYFSSSNVNVSNGIHSRKLAFEAPNIPFYFNGINGQLDLTHAPSNDFDSQTNGPNHHNGQEGVKDEYEDQYIVKNALEHIQNMHQHFSLNQALTLNVI